MAYSPKFRDIKRLAGPWVRAVKIEENEYVYKRPMFISGVLRLTDEADNGDILNSIEMIQ